MNEKHAAFKIHATMQINWYFWASAREHSCVHDELENSVLQFTYLLILFNASF